MARRGGPPFWTQTTTEMTFPRPAAGWIGLWRKPWQKEVGHHMDLVEPRLQLRWHSLTLQLFYRAVIVNVSWQELLNMKLYIPQIQEANSLQFGIGFVPSNALLLIWKHISGLISYAGWAAVRWLALSIYCEDQLIDTHSYNNNFLPFITYYRPVTRNFRRGVMWMSDVYACMHKHVNVQD